MIKVSVIVPVYNVQKYVKKCIDSILAQTLSDLEILCVDDGSTDNSGGILDEYAEKYSHLKVVHKKNEGYGNTVNLGLEMAQGEYIGIVESDDFVEADMYEELYTVAKEKNLDFIKAGYWEYSEKGRNWIDRLTDVECDVVFSEYENMNKLFAPKSIWAGIYRREFLLKKEICFLKTPGASYQDTSFWFKVCIAAKKGYFTKKAYVNYRIDNVSSSVNSKDKVYYVCDEMKECERYLWESELDVERIYPFFVFYKKAVYTWNLERILPEFRRKFIKKISAELRRDVTHSFMNVPMFFKDWYCELLLLAEFSEGYCQYMNGDFLKIAIQGPEDLLTLIEKENIYLYGAGKVGHRLERFIKKHKPEYIAQYIVSKPEDSVSNNIYTINNEQLDMERSILIAISAGQDEKEMTVRALNRGFGKIVFLENSMKTYLRRGEQTSFCENV